MSPTFFKTFSEPLFRVQERQAWCDKANAALPEDYKLPPFRGPLLLRRKEDTVATTISGSSAVVAR